MDISFSVQHQHFSYHYFQHSVPQISQGCCGKLYNFLCVHNLSLIHISYYYDDSGVLKSQSVLGSAVFENYNTEKESVVSGGYTYFFPDKVYVNTMDLTDAGRLERTVNLETGAIYSVTGDGYFEVVLEPCDLDGNPVDGEASYMRLMRKKYSLQNGEKGDFIGYMAYAAGFSDLDTVTISGFSLDELNGDYSIQKVDVQNTYIVLPGSKEVMQTGGITVTVARLVPDMYYVVAAGNRLWGCRFGVDEDGNPINEIYASALGDPKNWSKFLGVSTRCV